MPVHTKNGNSPGTDLPPSPKTQSCRGTKAPGPLPHGHGSPEVCPPHLLVFLTRTSPGSPSWHLAEDLTLVRPFSLPGVTFPLPCQSSWKHFLISHFLTNVYSRFAPGKSSLRQLVPEMILETGSQDHISRLVYSLAGQQQPPHCWWLVL